MAISMAMGGEEIDRIVSLFEGVALRYGVRRSLRADHDELYLFRKSINECQQRREEKKREQGVI